MIVLSPSLIVGLSAGSRRWPLILYDNLVTTSNIAVDHEDADFPAVRLANPNTNEVFKSDTTGAQSWVVSLTGTSDVDCVGIARPNFGSAGITVALDVDLGAGYVEVASVVPADDSPLMFSFASGTPIAIRIRLGAGSAPPEAAHLRVGRALQVPTGLQPGHVPIPMGINRDIISGRSERGDYLGRIESGGSLRSTATFKMLEPDFVRQEIKPFLDDGGPFFFAWAPLSYPNEVGYVWATNDPVPPIAQAPNWSDLTLELEGIWR